MEFRPDSYQLNTIFNKIGEQNLVPGDFLIDIDNEPFISQTINNLGPRIGGGAFGDVYPTRDGRYAVKVIRMCDEVRTTSYCDDIVNILKPGKAFILIPSDTKMRYLLPNLISESVVGMFIGNMNTDNTCINFARVINSFILLNNRGVPVFYSIMNLHRPVITQGILDPGMGFNSPIQYFYFLFQASHGLLQAQEKYKFTHYDLHIGNILWNEWPASKNYISYPLPNNGNRVMIPKTECQYIVKITDYGFSRMETEGTLITPLRDDAIISYNYGEFNSFYDIISLIGTTIMDTTLRTPFNGLFGNIALLTRALRFVLWMFDDKEITIPDLISLRDLKQIHSVIANKYWNITRAGNVHYRPKPYDNKFVKYYNVRSMVEIVNELANILVEHQAVVKDVNRDDVIRIRRLSDDYKTYPDMSVVETPSYEAVPGYGNYDVSIYRTFNIEDVAKVKLFKITLNEPPKSYNWTFSASQLANCPLQEHYVTTAEINTRLAGKRGYNFNTLCCKLDPANYLRENENIFGVVINGGFFAMGSDNLPIGSYRDDNGSIAKYTIPEKYRDMYAYIWFKGSKIGISTGLDDAKENGDQYFASGPLIIKDGVKSINPNELRLQCELPSNVKPPLRVLNHDDKYLTLSGYYRYDSSPDGTCSRQLVQDEITIARCDKIKPGEFAHGSNPNPRSALAILGDGRVVLITVEGRDQRGVGADLGALADLILILYPNTVVAINMDGGRSSNLVFKRPEEPDKVYISNPDHVYQYPVGNILTFTTL